MKKFVFSKHKKHWLRRLLKKTSRRWISVEKKHLKNSSNSKPHYHNAKIKGSKYLNSIVTISAPKVMSLRHGKMQPLVMSFIEALEKLSKKCAITKDKILINFSATSKIHPDACVLLIATVDNIRHLYPQLRFKVRKPIKNPSSIFDPHAILCHLGFYKLLGLNYNADCSSKYVKCWQYVSSDETEGAITKPLVEELIKMGVDTRGMYKSYMEAIANAIEHAYMDEIKLPNENQLKKWWMILARIDNELQLYVCDKGHGIPNTLKLTQSEHIFKLLVGKVKGLLELNKDCLYIKASMLVKETKKEVARETRTELSYRGKGKDDIKSFIDKTEGSELVVHSNRGVFIYKGKEAIAGSCYNNPASINGTILQWSMPIQE
ncbi:hypothetical protein A9G28_09765 [Gilliamella sp. Fer1-1]|jgi:hypothetical protein|uniref:hypothetical protein n=1 Tax=Gilliamella sp. Fer1-1 TaxID=3120240 RepID=UPI00080DAFED|nr:hypothetical protein [Gilliamella apicola]OCG39338.1 hypothetical protein A9G28_09765 [Gilliamella apicola]